MSHPTAVIVACILALARDEGSLHPETVQIRAGTLTLSADLWRPAGRGPFPGVLFNHGSARPAGTPAGDQDQRDRIQEAGILGPVFARHGYVFLFLFRRGEGLSAGQGVASGALMARELGSRGQEGRNDVQLDLLETNEMSDAMAGLVFLRALPEVDPRRVAVLGHSFGGSLTLLMAERDPTLRAAVAFGAAAASWEGSPPLQARLLAAVSAAKAPIFLIHAANDYSVAPARRLGDEMARLHKPYRVKIYPPVGATADEGHRFVFARVQAWERDVFGFLAEHTRR